MQTLSKQGQFYSLPPALQEPGMFRTFAWVLKTLKVMFGVVGMPMKCPRTPAAQGSGCSWLVFRGPLLQIHQEHQGQACYPGNGGTLVSCAGSHVLVVAREPASLSDSLLQGKLPGSQLLFLFLLTGKEEEQNTVGLEVLGGAVFVSGQTLKLSWHNTKCWCLENIFFVTDLSFV